MKTLDRKKIIWCIAIVLIAVAIYYFFFRKKKSQVVAIQQQPKQPSENSFEGGSGGDGRPVNEELKLPDYFQLQYKISTQGKKSVFPMVIEKITDGPMELPNRRSLISKDVKYKFIDVMPGDTINAVSIQRLNYVMGSEVITDDFLVTDKDYVISYSQAKDNFKIAY
jgi:hypothetical protein